MDAKNSCNDDFLKKYNNIIKLLDYYATNTPDKIAYTYLEDDQEHSSISYEDLYKNIYKLATQLGEYKDQRAILLFPSGIDYVVAFFACLLAKVIAVPAYPPTNNRNIGRINSIIINSRASILLSNGNVYNKLTKISDFDTSSIKRVLTDVDLDINDEFIPPVISPNDIAFLQYTSGSIADPKGVVLTHSNIMHNMHRIKSYFNTGKNTTFISWLPLYHDMGLIGTIIHPVYLGGSCVFMSPQSFLQKPIRWIKAISDYKGTITGAPNFAYEYCVQKIDMTKYSNINLQSLSVAFNGAEAVHKATLEKFIDKFKEYGFVKESFLPCYGMAESTLFIVGSTSYSLIPLDTEAYINNEIKVVDTNSDTNLIGYIIDHSDQEILIVDPGSCQICDEATVGEIWLQSASVGQGYWEKPQSTLHTFQAVTDCGSGPFMRTGDLGFKYKNSLYVTGRLKDVILIHGQNFYPQDIEYTAIDASKELVSNSCAAFSISSNEEESLIVLIERPRELKSDFESICKTIRSEISNKFGIQPKEVIFSKLGDIPKTSSGKIKHQACRERYLSDSLNIIYKDDITCNEADKESASSENISLNNENSFDTQDSIESYLIALFSELLKHDKKSIDIHASLFDLGLESLNAADASYKISQDFSITLEPVSFLDVSTIKDLTNLIMNMLKQN